MSVALSLRPPRTVEEFLDWEQYQEDLRFEWDGVQPVAMVGGNFAHSELASRLNDILRTALRGRCTVVRADVRVMTEGGSRVRYPDLVVTCSPMRPKDRAIPDPVLIVEVLSETTAGVDRGIKRAEYAALPSVLGYVILAQDEAAALVYARAEDFAERMVTLADGPLALPGLGLSVDLNALYAGLV